MANRKKLRRKYFHGQLKWADMTEDEQRYISKVVEKRRVKRMFGEGYGRPSGNRFENVQDRKTEDGYSVFAVEIPTIVFEE
jgi:hypothetical protein